jgi:hypothetical protein
VGGRLDRNFSRVERQYVCRMLEVTSMVTSSVEGKEEGAEDGE